MVGAAGGHRQLQVESTAGDEITRRRRCAELVEAGGGAFVELDDSRSSAAA